MHPVASHLIIWLQGWQRLVKSDVVILEFLLGLIGHFSAITDANAVHAVKYSKLTEIGKTEDVISSGLSQTKDVSVNDQIYAKNECLKRNVHWY